MAEGTTTEGTTSVKGHDDELARLRIELEIAETKRKLAEARQPWWLSGSTVTGIIGLLAATLPVTSGIQSCAEKERNLSDARRAAELQARDRYLDNVLKEPRNAQVVLRFVEATTDDQRVRDWASRELQKLGSQIDHIDQQRGELYLRTIGVVSRLANKAMPGADSEDLTQFWNLYNNELVSVESSVVESLMVQFGRKLKACSANEPCEPSELRDLAFQLARQMKKEMAQAEQKDPQPHQ